MYSHIHCGSCAPPVTASSPLAKLFNDFPQLKIENLMTRMVQCKFLGREAEGLTRKPLPGELGERIYNEISAAAWREWMEHQTMLINENRLSPIDPNHRKYLENQAEAFLFGGKVDAAAGYVPPQ